MPKVPNYNIKPLSPAYGKKQVPPTIKQLNLLITLCERRKIPLIDTTGLDSVQVIQIISNMINSG